MLKTIVVGIDGLSWSFVDPLLHAGRVPRLAGLIDRGLRAAVRSTVPTISPVAWSSFITGLVPKHHRVLDWYARSADGARRPVSSQDRHGIPFWEYLNRTGIRTGVMNIPATFPANALEGFMTAGFDAPHGSSKGVYPEALGAEIRRRFGAEVLEHPPQSLIETDGPEAYAQAYMRHDRQLTEAAIALSHEHDITALVLNYQTVDHFNHHLPDPRHIDAALENIDRCIGRIADAFPEATWVLMSDHGSRKTSRAFLLVDWLEYEGFVALDRQGLRGSAVRQAIRARVPSAGFPGRAAAAAGDRIGRRLSAPACDAVVRWLHPTAPVALWPVPFIDQTRSLVAAVSPGTCGFYFRRTLSSAERSQVSARRGELVKRLSALRDPQGSPLFRAVYTRDDLFADCDWVDLPDVIAVSDEADARPVSTSLYPQSSDGFFVPSEAVRYYGGHTLDGIGVFSGVAFRADASAAVGMNLWDLPAIILHLHGVPIPENFDGVVPEIVFTDAFRAAHPIQTQQASATTAPTGATGDDDPDVTERLRALGYL